MKSQLYGALLSTLVFLTVANADQLFTVKSDPGPAPKPGFYKATPDASGNNFEPCSKTESPRRVNLADLKEYNGDCPFRAANVGIGPSKKIIFSELLDNGKSVRVTIRGLSEGEDRSIDVSVGSWNRISKNSPYGFVEVEPKALQALENGSSLDEKRFNDLSVQPFE